MVCSVLNIAPPLSSPPNWQMWEGAKRQARNSRLAGLRQVDGDGRVRACSDVSSSLDLGRAGPAAAARVAEANVAAAAALAAGFQAIAAGLQHLTALGVAAGAGDAAAVLRVLALAVTAAEIEVANLDAIPGAAAGAGAITKSLTKALQRGTGHRIIARTMEAEAPLALLEPQFTPWHHADIRRGSRGGGIRRPGSRRRSGRKSTSTFHDSAGHKQHSFGERVHRWASQRDWPGLPDPS